ncbi:hypothetical protein ONZ51_g13101 [Trametes cubensis]|uniref:Transposase n=1 Tax=Trametes cubensis TaxID=1111947 RepID=A0AAD7TEY1_9APHY|nr:hypothetical protein ONZ51_g13101 [Trametes cubensis]
MLLNGLMCDGTECGDVCFYVPVAAMVGRSVNKDIKKRAAALAAIGYDAPTVADILGVSSVKRWPVSISTVQHSLKTLGYSVKKLRKAAAQHHELTRQQRKADILSCFTADQLVFVDESSEVDRTSERRYGRAVAAKDAVKLSTLLPDVLAFDIADA